MNVWSEVVPSNNFLLSTEMVLMYDIGSFTLSKKEQLFYLTGLGTGNNVADYFAFTNFLVVRHQGLLLPSGEECWNFKDRKSIVQNSWRNIQIATLMVP